MPKKYIVPAFFSAALVIALLSIRPLVTLESQIARFLNQDTIYLKDATVLRGWIWNENGELIAGEKENGEIFVYPKLAVKDIRKDTRLSQLQGLL